MEDKVPWELRQNAPEPEKPPIPLPPVSPESSQPESGPRIGSPDVAPSLPDTGGEHQKLDPEARIDQEEWGESPADEADSGQPTPQIHGTIPSVQIMPETRTPIRDNEEDYAKSIVYTSEESKLGDGAAKIGIAGGKGAGKSYLYHALVYQAFAKGAAGVMGHYLSRHAVRLFGADLDSRIARELDIGAYLHNYLNYIPLPHTSAAEQNWYRLRLTFRSGLFGTQVTETDVDLLDGSGELLGSGYVPKSKKTWDSAFVGARVMVFCLPLWVVFPTEEASSDPERASLLGQFRTVVKTYHERYHPLTQRPPIRSILALTMADDEKCALEILVRRWIHPFLGDDAEFPARLRGPSGVTRYLASARQFSEYLHTQFKTHHDKMLGELPNTIYFGGAPPWLVPVTAMDGRRLNDCMLKYPTLDKRPPGLRLPQPQPAHAELPLLIALCEQYNALM